MPMTPPALLYLSAADVRQALPMPDAMAAMREAFVRLSCGQVALPPRLRVDVAEEGGVALFMPCHCPTLKLLGLKTITLFDRNRQLDLPLVHALVTLVDGTTGVPLAVMDGAALTMLRTGAASGVATDCLARPDAAVVAVFGAGVQARTQLEAVCCARRVESARVYDRDAPSADRFADEMSWRLGISVTRADSAAATLKDAGIVCTATTSRTPVFDDGDLATGVHINAVGAYHPDVSEVPVETVCRARIVVDHRPSAMDEAGDLLIPLRRGLVAVEPPWTELGEVLAGRVAGRESADQTTLFKSVGVAIQDLYAAARALANARTLHLGTELPR